VVPFLLEPFEPLGDLLAAGREVVQRDDLLLIRINEALQLPLSMLPLCIDTVQWFLALTLLPVLDVLPQGIFWENHLRVLEQLTAQAPHQGIETVRAHTSGGTTLHASHGHRVLAGTARIQILIALADAPWVSSLPVPLTLPTAHERPQEIPL
jgi:hypothetical protein